MIKKLIIVILALILVVVLVVRGNERRLQIAQMVNNPDLCFLDEDCFADAACNGPFANKHYCNSHECSVTFRACFGNLPKTICKNNTCTSR